MPSELSIYIIQYGYLAIFLLVFLQAIGIPNPFPVEFILMFVGYIVYTGLLNLFFVLATVVLADSAGAVIIYCIFYFGGSYILRNKPRWLPISQKTIDKLMVQVEKGGVRSIYIARLTPFLRGYISVMAGLLQIKPSTFLPIILLSSFIWSFVCLITGRLLAPYWNKVEYYFGDIKMVLLLGALVLALVFLTRYFKKSFSRKNSKV